MTQPSTAGSSAGAAGRDEILGKLRERILAYAASRMQRDVAEDLVQDVLMLLERKYPNVESLEELAPLSFQILRFKMLGRQRKSARRGEQKQVALDEAPLSDPKEDPERSAQLAEQRERLRAAMLKLEGRCRALFRLKLEGKTFAEIQEILDAGSINTIYTWDFRCRKQLGGAWEANR